MTRRALISVEALNAALEADEDILIFDCEFDLADPGKGRQLYEQGHLPGARYLDLDADLAGRPTGRNGRHPLPDREAFAATLRSHGLKAGQQVVAYDSAGNPYAARLWWLLRWIGHDAAAVLDGGKPAWVEAGLPLESGAMRPVEPGTYQVGPPKVAAPVDADEVLANLDSRARLVIDARSPERFRGDPNPLDPVAGHIPGARNRFFKDNLDAGGRFKPADQLAAEFGRLLAGRPADQAILQCGSGVTACHNALAMALADLDGASLYPGSWSEWISDPTRPVARGS